MNQRSLLALLVLAAVTTAGDGPVTRVYSVSSLVQRESRPSDRAELLAWAPFSLLGTTQRLALRDSDFATGDLPDRAHWAALVEELFRSFPNENVQITRAATGEQLLVRATPAQHETFSRLLDALRAGGGAAVEVGIHHYSIPAARLDPQTRRRLAGSAAADAETLRLLARLDLHGGRRGGTVIAPLGRWTAYRAVRETRYTPDYEVEIAQASSIPDPVPAVIADGIKAAVRPFLLADGRMLVRLVASAGDLEDLREWEMAKREFNDDLRLRNTDFGRIEQADYRGCAAATEIELPAGGAALLVLGSPQDGEQGRWEVLSFALNRAPPAVRPNTFVVLPAGALGAADAEYALRWRVEGEPVLDVLYDGPEPRLELKALVGLTSVDVEHGEFVSIDESLHGGCLLIRASEQGSKQAMARIAAIEKETIVPARLRVAFVKSGGDAPLGVLGGPLTAGRAAVFSAYRRLDYVGDYDVEVAQEARIADPKHRVASAGLFANARLSPHGPRTWRLRLDLTVAAFAGPMREFRPESGGVPTLQSMPVRKLESVYELDLARGRAQTIDLGANPFDPKGESSLLAVVTID